MSTVATAPPPRQRRPKPPRFFSVTFRIENSIYGIIPLRDVSPEVAVKAYRFLKRGKGGAVVERYDVRQTPEGRVECHCKGFLRWDHCKHVETLIAAGMLTPPKQS
jgi:hypothetical protein